MGRGQFPPPGLALALARHRFRHRRRGSVRLMFHVSRFIELPHNICVVRESFLDAD